MSIDDAIKEVRSVATELQRVKFGYTSLLKADEVDSDEMRSLAKEMLEPLPELADRLLSAINGDDE